MHIFVCIETTLQMKSHRYSTAAERARLSLLEERALRQIIRSQLVGPQHMYMPSLLKADLLFFCFCF